MKASFSESRFRVKHSSVQATWNLGFGVNDVHWTCSGCSKIIHTPDIPLSYINLEGTRNCTNGWKVTAFLTDWANRLYCQNTHLCLMSRVTCHLSHVTCIFLCFEASPWRVYYQWARPRLVSISAAILLVEFGQQALGQILLPLRPYYVFVKISCSL